MREAATGARRIEGLGRRCRAHGVGAHLPGLGAHLPGAHRQGSVHSRAVAVPALTALLQGTGGATESPRRAAPRCRQCGYRVAPLVERPVEDAGAAQRGGAGAGRNLPGRERFCSLPVGSSRNSDFRRNASSRHTEDWLFCDLLRSLGTGFQGNLDFRSAISTCWDWAPG